MELRASIRPVSSFLTWRLQTISAFHGVFKGQAATTVASGRSPSLVFPPETVSTPACMLLASCPTSAKVSSLLGKIPPGSPTRVTQQLQF